MLRINTELAQKSAARNTVDGVEYLRSQVGAILKALIVPYGIAALEHVQIAEPLASQGQALHFQVDSADARRQNK